MLDLKYIRENPDLVKQAVAAKHEDCDIDAILETDAKRRALIGEKEQLEAQKNKATKAIAEAKKAVSESGSERARNQLAMANRRSPKCARWGRKSRSLPKN